VKSIIPVCKRNDTVDFFFWRELAVVSLLSDTLLTADYMAQFLEQSENKDALNFFFFKSNI